MPISIITALASGGPKLSLSGESITGTVSGASVIAGIRVNTDGTIDSLKGTTYAPIDAATDWIMPNSAATSTYEVRITAVTFNAGSAFASEAAAEDAWIDLSANREWTVQDTNAGPAGNQDVDFTLEIRLGSSGNALKSGSYTLLADYDTS
jgi:hypothetical protein